MTVPVRTLAAAIIVAALSAALPAQQPARDAGVAAGKHVGTSVIAGVVTLGDDAKTPVRRAVVTHHRCRRQRKTRSDQRRRRTLRDRACARGSYTLEADKPAHVTIVYGAHRPGRHGTMLIVADGERLNDLTLSLRRGARRPRHDVRWSTGTQRSDDCGVVVACNRRRHTAGRCA